MTKRILILLSTLVLLNCSSTSTNSHMHQSGYTESGKASFYAMKFQSRKTANGERFNQQASTAAHKKLPFGTKVKVTNIKNGKSVIVRINDRGPFIAGRIIDLSRSAFSTIGHLDTGILDVRIKVIQ